MLKCMFLTTTYIVSYVCSKLTINFYQALQMVNNCMTVCAKCNTDQTLLCYEISIYNNNDDSRQMIQKEIVMMIERPVEHPDIDSNLTAST